MREELSSFHDHSCARCWPCACASVCVCVCVNVHDVYVSSSVICSLKRKLRVGRGWDKPEATRLGSHFGAGASLR